MENKRKQYSAEFKLKVVLESLQRETTLEEVRKKFGVTRERIRQLQNIALSKLRRALAKKERPVDVELPVEA